MSLRVQLLAAAAVIVAVSLLLGGGLTWYLIRQLQLDNAQAQLARLAVQERGEVLHAECADPQSVAGQPCNGGIKNVADAAVFNDRLTRLATNLPIGHLIILDKTGVVIYDSDQPANDGTQVHLANSRRLGGLTILDARYTAAGAPYIGAATDVHRARTPENAYWLVIGEDQATALGPVASRFVVELLGAGLAGLLFSIGIALLLSRAITKPLNELVRASEDIAGGNYSRRVRVSSTAEIATVGSAFNRMAEAVERARRTQRDFLANVSHELKTPLTSLIGFSQALLDGSVRSEAEQQRAASIIHEEAHRVLRLAQELLDLARVESGQVSMHMQVVDLASLVEQEVEMVRLRARERGLDLAFSPSPQSSPVQADPERLHQIVNNLLDNAVKYAAPRSAVQVVVEPRDGFMETRVANHISGPPPDPHRMFDRFYRADPSRSSAAGGVGLGLAISRQLAEAQGGRLWADLNGDGQLRMRLALITARPTRYETRTGILTQG